MTPTSPMKPNIVFTALLSGFLRETPLNFLESKALLSARGLKFRCGVLIQRLINESVGSVIIFPRNVLEDDVRELHRELLNLVIERRERRHLHAVLTGELLHDQFTVQIADQPI